jgi:hypothetical protein
MYRRVSMAISSTGRSNPAGRVHCPGTCNWVDVFVHGLFPDPRFLALQATATSA